MFKKILIITLCIFFIQFVIFAMDEKIISDEIEILKAKDEEQVGHLEEKIDIHIKKWQAKNKLVKIGSDSVLPLIETLKDENAKYYAIRALGEIQDERAVDALCEILLDTTYPTRRYAAMALGRIKSKKAIKTLEQALKNDDEPGVKKDARIALQEINK